MEKQKRYEYFNIPTSDNDAEKILKNLGCDIKNKKELIKTFENKTVLDVGAGAAKVEQYFRKHPNINTKIISLDPKYDIEKLNSYLDSNIIAKTLAKNKEFKLNLISGKLEELSFKDGSFDLIISHLFFPGYSVLGKDKYKKNRERVEKELNEILRILKSEGEARLYPVSLPETVNIIRDILKEKGDCIVNHNPEKNLLIIKRVNRPVTK